MARQRVEAEGVGAGDGRVEPLDGLEWSQAPVPGARLVAEREHLGDIDFAGLQYEFGPDFQGAAYTLEVQPAR